jgi:hypothetical protein
MAVTTREPVEGLRIGAAARAQDTAAADNVTPPVRWWAALGALAIVFIAYVLIKWVTGPYFKHVPQGPTQTPTWMHVELVAWQALSIPAALGLLYWFVVRPWRRDRHVGVDGILLIGFSLMWFQDPLSSAANHWFVYNTSMVNMGSWANSVPWFAAFGKPGAMTSEPILFTPAAYVYIMLIGAAIGCASMRLAKRRWPSISTGALVAWCFASMCVFDIVLEGIIWLPLGVFEYPSGHWALFPSTYHKYPLQETFTIASVFTALACLRFFTDDKGRMWFERGIDRVRGGAGRKLALRGLAAIGVAQVVMFLGYNVPNTFLGLKPTAWPKAVQERSYFTNFLCGAGTNRPCPGSSVPTIRNGGAYISPAGKVVIPKGKTIPATVPFIKHG